MKNDYTEVKQRYRIEQVIGGLVTLRPAGSKLVGLCPFHGEKTPSFTVTPKTGKYKCFGCSKGGDVVDFVREYYKLDSDAAAIEKLTGAVLVPVKMPPVTLTDMEKATWVHPAPAPAQITHKKYGAPAMRFDYRDAQGNLLFCVCRFNLPDGKKVVLPYSFWQAEDGRRFWAWRGVPTPRPLYGLDRLAGVAKNATVVLVEGEKAADAAQRLLPHAACVTWCGGTGNTRTADFTPLTGRRVLLWPDADTTHEYKEPSPKAGQVMPWEEQPGNMAMLQITERLQGVAATVKWIETPVNVPCGWDAADAEADGWTTDQTRTFIKNSVREVEEMAGAWYGRHPVTQEPLTHPESIEETPIEIDQTDDEAAPPPPTNQRKTKIIPGAEVYYKPLGYELSDGARTLYWVFNYAKQTALCFTSSALAREPGLFEIAPLEYWETYFNKKGGKIDVQNACSHIMEACTQKGFFTPGNMRGRGAWEERGGVIVFNTGADIITAGAKVPISGFATPYAYSRGDEIRIDPALYMPDDEARAMAGAFKNINFERITSRYLLAGWAVLAPFSGALEWRPHIWLNGGAGTGKSWILTNIIRRMVGDDIALYVQGNTTEAGIRQTMRTDALPVVFDEAEAEDDRAGDRIKGVLELARASSSSNGGVIAKGSAGGKSSRDAARIMFCFGSIVVAASQESDRSRITNIALVTPRDDEKDARWAALQQAAAEVFTDAACAALRARTLQNLPTILANVRTFTRVFREALGDQRAADQLGTLLAGAWSLHRNALITEDEARALVAKYDWQEDVIDRTTTDADRLLSRIREHIVQLDVAKGRVSMSVGEMIEMAAGRPGPDDAEVYNYDYNRHLGRLGVIVEDGLLYVSNNSSYIKTLLRGTPWHVNWHKVLGRLPGALSDKVRRFASVQSRAVAIPMALISGDEEQKPSAQGNIEDEIPF
jgi:putative DNA primase/helicase